MTLDVMVATAVALALLVDAGRLPVYLVTQGSALWEHWPEVVIALAGATVGTLAGARLLRRIPESVFRRIVGLLVLALGVYMFVRPS